MATINIKTPTKNFSVKDPKNFVKDKAYYEDIKMRTAELALGQLSRAAKVAADRQVYIMATFFQRVVSRTPLDEKYLVTVTRKDGTTRTFRHKIDTIVCQDDWYITDGKTKMTAKQMKAIDDRMFLNVNDKYAITQIRKILKEKFDVTGDTEFEVGNDNPHFQLLEEGNSRWMNDGMTAGKDWRGKPKNEAIYREHGVKNMHSIQAPVGMWRISLAELELMKQSSATSPLTSRYRPQIGRTMTKPPNRKKLAEFARLLESRGDIAYKDIVEYLEKY